MPRPYNKKTVADAIAMLDVYASNQCSVEAAADAVGVRPSSTAYRVVDTMIDKLADMFPDDRLAYVAGEAAGLLREGWRLGDEIPKHPNTQVSATLKNVDAILRETYPAETVEHLVSEPSPAFAATMYGVTRTSAPSAWAVGQCASDEPKDTTVQSAPEALADVLDAVEEPTDEMIAGVVCDDCAPVEQTCLCPDAKPTDEMIATIKAGSDSWSEETKEGFGFDYGASDLDTTEPSE